MAFSNYGSDYNYDYESPGQTVPEINPKSWIDKLFGSMSGYTKDPLNRQQYGNVNAEAMRALGSALTGAAFSPTWSEFGQRFGQALPAFYETRKKSALEEEERGRKSELFDLQKENAQTELEQRKTNLSETKKGIAERDAWAVSVGEGYDEVNTSLIQGVNEAVKRGDISQPEGQRMTRNLQTRLAAFKNKRDEKSLDNYEDLLDDVGKVVNRPELKKEVYNEIRAQMALKSGF